MRYERANEICHACVRMLQQECQVRHKITGGVFAEVEAESGTGYVKWRRSGEVRTSSIECTASRTQFVAVFVSGCYLLRRSNLYAISGGTAKFGNVHFNTDFLK